MLTNLMFFPVPTNEGPELNSTKTEGKGIGFDRCNANFFNDAESNDQLGITIGSSTYSPKQKIGVEAKLLSKAGVNDDEVVVVHHDLNDKRKRFTNIAPLKLNFEHMDINHAPCAMLGNADEETNRRT